MPLRVSRFRAKARPPVPALLAHALFSAALMMLPIKAFAHDAFGQTDWIGDSGYKNRLGQLCCGWNDCPSLREEDIEDRADGVYLKMYHELVPWSEVQPSADGRTYRCAWPTPSQRKCFFRKMPGS